jgi:hypothetical protein
MNRTSELVFVDQALSDQRITNETYWHFFKDTVQLFDTPLQDRVRYVSELVNEIQNHPKDLTAHIQRIFCCYREDLTDPLFAALVDFLIVLNKRGKAISRRMITGAASKLSDQQCTLLKSVINEEIDDILLIEGNCYSIFCRGVSGTVNLIEKMGTNELTRHDPLKLAQDAVEYCQLEEAMLILESALAEQLKRIELHESLLELYKLTQNRARFENTLARLRDIESFMADKSLQKGWNQLKDYFISTAE